MSKFNLNMYKKAEKSIHTDKMLQEYHEIAPNFITDKQLQKDYRVEVMPDSTLEKQLEKVRVEDDVRTIEGRLNKSKGKFDIKHRNEDAYTGDINKLEEKRVAKNKIEDEKYELASETKKEMRWWETKSEDGLKIANSNTAIKKIAKDDDGDLPFPSTPYRRDSRDFESLEKMWNQMEGEEDVDPSTEFQTFESKDEDNESNFNKELFVAEKRDPISSKNMPYGAFYSIAYDPDAWDNDEDLRQAVIEKIINLRPDLEGKISEEMLDKGRSDNSFDHYDLRLIGEEFDPNVTEEVLEEIEPDFTEIDFGTTDIGGTEMLTGKIKISVNVNMDEESLRSAIADFIQDKHPEIKINADSIDINPSGETATFAISNAFFSPEQSEENIITTPSVKAVAPTAAPAVAPEEDFEIIKDMTKSPEKENFSPEEDFEIIKDVSNETKKASSYDKIVVSKQHKKK